MRNIVQTIQRKILFFRSDLGPNGAGEPSPYDPISDLNTLKSLTNRQKYFDLIDGQKLYCWIDRITPPYRIRLAKLRQDGLPEIEENGTLKRLQIPPRASLAETTHIVFFDKNIVGVEFNYYGPRISALRNYLKEKVARNNLWFHSLLEPRISEKLKSIRELSMFRLKITPSIAASIREMDEDVFKMVNVASRTSRAHEVEIVLKSNTRAGNWLSPSLLKFAKTFIRSADTVELPSSFLVKGKNGEDKFESIDLLNTLLSSERKVSKSPDKGRAVVSDSAFREIENAFEERKDDIMTSSGVTIE